MQSCTMTAFDSGKKSINNYITPSSKTLGLSHNRIPSSPPTVPAENPLCFKMLRHLSVNSGEIHSRWKDDERCSPSAAARRAFFFCHR